LPLICTLRHCSDSERAVITAVVEQDEMSLDDFRAVSGLVKKHGGIEYTVEAARFYINRCKGYLDMFAPSPVREALLSLSEYVVSRSK
jgi:octaprenyl-diphosphate synthase